MGVLSREEFEELVRVALDGLPPDLATHASNLEIVVEDVPGVEAERMRLSPGSTLLGLYQGIPLTQRGMHYAAVLPDRITIYQENIERSAGSPEAIPEAVRRTVIHEMGHHFGIDDDRLADLGW